MSGTCEKIGFIKFGTTHIQWFTLWITCRNSIFSHVPGTISGKRAAQTLCLSKSAALNLMNVHFLLTSRFGEAGSGHPPRRLEETRSLNGRDSALAGVAPLGACPGAGRERRTVGARHGLPVPRRPGAARFSWHGRPRPCSGMGKACPELADGMPCNSRGTPGRAHTGRSETAATAQRPNRGAVNEASMTANAMRRRIP